MDSLIKNYRDADGQAVQPYFAAFMIEHGYERASDPFKRDGHNCRFMEWNSARWAEFEREHGYPVAHHTRNCRSAEYIEWLDRRSLDFAARNFVEAA
jgi:hypothetical protein